MTKEHIPGFEIIKTTIEGIERSVRIESVKYDSDKMVHKFLLTRDAKTCEISLPRSFLDDLNDYTGSRKSKYWLALEGNLKKRLSIAMQLAGLIPFSSNIFFAYQQDWEPDDGHNIDVFFSKDDYEIFQDGLKQVYHYLEDQKASISHLKLNKFPYEEDQKYIQNMLFVRNQQVSERGSCDFRDRISVTSRMHLKAAALAEFILLETEMIHGEYSDAVKNEIVKKIKTILGLLSTSFFERIKVPEYMQSYHEEKILPVQVSTKLEHMKKEYDFVISFAGEDRDHAEKLAGLLKKDCFSVFYDRYEEHDLWGKDLYEHLTEIYSKHGKYCVMFLSKHYAAKQWTTLERKAAQARAFKENKEYILPIRIDDTAVPGMLDTVGYQDLREKSIEDIYEILKRKLLPGKELARVEPEVDSIGRLGLSDDAISLVKLLSDRSEHGRADDPSLTAQEVLDALNLSEEAIAIAADELHEKGFVKLVKAVSMGKIGFRYISTTEALFASTDSYLKEWDPEKDSVTLAQVLVALEKEGYGVSIKEADDNLRWGPRRLNPALFLLIVKDMVDPSKSIHPDYISIYAILKPKIRRYIKSVKN